MAKKKRKGSGGPLTLPLAVHRALPLFGLLLALMAVLVGLRTWNEGSARALGGTIDTQRSQAALTIAGQVASYVQRFDEQRARREVRVALGAGDEAAAAAAFRQGWPDPSAVGFHAPDLSEVVAGNMSAFGYGRLALLERVVASNSVRASVIRDGGTPVLAVAGPVMEGNRVLAIAVASIPLAALQAALDRNAPSGAYLGLKQGRFLVHEAGDASLARFAESNVEAVAGTNLRIVAAAPETSGTAQGELLGYGLAGLLLLAGIGVVALQKRALPTVQGEIVGGPVDQTTLAEIASAPKPEAGAEPATAPKAARAAPAGVALERGIFRAYDVRGVVGKTLDAGIARLLGQAIGTVMQEQGLREIVVGRDGRLSGPQLSEGLIQGLRDAGRNVIDIGQAATPLVYFAGFHFRTGTGVAITGSHNPPDYNGFKIVVGGETLSGKAIEGLYARIVEGRLHQADAPGEVRQAEVSDDYVQRIAGDIQLERPMRVVVDCGNGVPGLVAPAVLEAIGAEVVPLFCEVDGDFPNHHPDPSDPKNLVDLINMVQRMDAEIGIALDGDGDRLGVVTRSGEVIYPDRLLMLLAEDVLNRNPGACVLYDVKCTGHLAGHILRHGGSPVMWMTGHSLIKAKMKETEAELAGEMSGHFFFRERWYGFDDGIYAAARLLEILAADPRTPEEAFASLPKGVSTPELKIDMAEGEGHRFVERFRAEARFEGARIVTIDGLRADWSDGWGLVRASNTTPVLVLRFDADNEEALERIKGVFREQLLAVDPDLVLPF